MSLAHKIITLLKVFFLCLFTYEKYLYYYKITSFSCSYVIKNTDDCVFNYEFKLFSKLITKITFNYSERTNPHHLSVFLNKIDIYYNSSSCNKYKFGIYIAYDLIICLFALATLTSSYTPTLSLILLLDSLLNLSSFVFHEFNIDKNSEEEMLRIFKRFFQLFVPAYFTDGIKDFFSAGYRILVSNEFFSVTLSILSLIIMIYITMLTFIYGEKANENKSKTSDSDVILKKAKLIKIN